MAVIDRLPDESFLKHWVRYGVSQTASHAGYHLATGLTLVGVLTPRNYKTVGFKKPTFSNFYSILVGSSGDAEKTLAMDLALDLMAQAAPSLVAPDPTAEETLMKMLEAQPAMMFKYPELAKFLSGTMGKDNNRGRKLRDTFTDIFDGRSDQKQYSNGTIITVTDPRVSFLGACTPQHLEELTVSLDWEGGLISRFFIMFGDRERQMSQPANAEAIWQWLVTWAIRSASHGAAGPCRGLAANAKPVWDFWYEDIVRRFRLAVRDERCVGIVARSRLLCAKIATILCWSAGLGWSPEPWEVPLWALERAIEIVELHMRSAMALIERIQPSHMMRVQRAVLNAVSPEEWTPLGAITKTAKVDLKDAKLHLATLREQGEVNERVQNAKQFFKRILDGRPIAYDPSMDELPAPPQLSVLPFPGSK